jgi:hypothetical protein
VPGPTCGRAAEWGANKTQDVILRAISRQITWHQAAEISGVTARPMRRRRHSHNDFAGRGEL